MSASAAYVRSGVNILPVLAPHICVLAVINRKTKRLLISFNTVVTRYYHHRIEQCYHHHIVPAAHIVLLYYYCVIIVLYELCHFITYFFSCHVVHRELFCLLRALLARGTNVAVARFPTRHSSFYTPARNTSKTYDCYLREYFVCSHFKTFHRGRSDIQRRTFFLVPANLN